MADAVIKFVFDAVMVVVVCVFILALGWEMIKGFLGWD